MAGTVSPSPPLAQDSPSVILRTIFLSKPLPLGSGLVETMLLEKAAPGCFWLLDIIPPVFADLDVEKKKGNKIESRAQVVTYSLTAFAFSHHQSYLLQKVGFKLMNRILIYFRTSTGIDRTGLGFCGEKNLILFLCGWIVILSYFYLRVTEALIKMWLLRAQPL